MDIIGTRRIFWAARGIQPRVMSLLPFPHAGTWSRRGRSPVLETPPRPGAAVCYSMVVVWCAGAERECVRKGGPHIHATWTHACMQSVCV
jgi:hypothetical protein